MTNEEIEALEAEFYGMEFRDSPWTQEDLDRRAEIASLLAAEGVTLG